MKKKEKKENKMSLSRQIINIALTFTVLTFVMNLIAGYIAFPAIEGKYALEFGMRLILTLCVIVLLVFTKKKHVLFEKKESFGKAMLQSWPILLITVIQFISAVFGLISNKEVFDMLNIISLLFMSFSIGFYEELFTRGWLQNTIVEKYGKNRKQVIISILISSFIFGSWHLLNIFDGQDVIYTIMQSVNATAIGFLLGAIYYKTKNIWSVIFLHAVYDFAILLPEINVIKDCSASNVNFYDSVSLLGLSLFYILPAIVILQKTKINDMVEEKEEITEEDKKDDKKFAKIYSVIAIVALVLVFFLPEGGKDNCIEYPEKEISEYSIHFSNYENYLLEEVTDDGEFKFTIGLNDELAFVIKNEVTQIEKVLNEGVYSYIVFEDDGRYKIVAYVFGSPDSKIYYSDFINLDNLSNEKEYLDELSESFKEYIVPDLSNGGYLQIKGSEEKHPLLVTESGHHMYIDENGKLNLIK